MSSQLNSIVRRVLAESEAHLHEVGGSERADDRVLRAMSDAESRSGLGQLAASAYEKGVEFAEPYVQAAAELPSRIGRAASSVAQAGLGLISGTAHAPSVEDERRYRDALRRKAAGEEMLPFEDRLDYEYASRSPSVERMLRSVATDVFPQLFLTRARIGAKIADAVGAGDPLREELGEETYESLLAGSLLHDILLGFTFTRHVVVAMALDSVVYATEGDEQAAVDTLAMAGVLAAGGRVLARRADDASRGVVYRRRGTEVIDKRAPGPKGPKGPFDHPIPASEGYDGLAQMVRNGNMTHIVPDPNRATTAVKLIERAGKRMQDAGVKNGAQIARDAAAAVRAGQVVAIALRDAQRAAEISRSARALIAPAEGGGNVLEAAKRKWNDVTVRKPVELPPDVRSAGRDWLESGREPSAEYAALKQKLTDARERARVDPTPENIASVEAARKEFYEKGLEDAKPGSAASDQGSDQADLMRRAKNVMSTPAFVSTAKQTYNKLGIDVNIVPIVGPHETMFDKYLTRYKKYQSDSEGKPDQVGARVVVVPHDEAKAILKSVEGVETKGGQVVGPAFVDTEGIGPDTITIVPVTNAAGLDSMPTPWMISHGIFDSAAGVLIIESGMMPRTKSIVDRVDAAYNKMSSAAADAVMKRTRGLFFGQEIELNGVKGKLYIDADSNAYFASGPGGAREYLPDNHPAVMELNARAAASLAMDKSGVVLASLPATFVNSLWGRNSTSITREILKKADRLAQIAAKRGGVPSNLKDPGRQKKLGAQDREEVASLINDLEAIQDAAAPAVGQTLKSIETAKMGRLKGTKQGVQSLPNYIMRGPTDAVAEIMTAAITKEVGYAPDLSLLDEPAAKILIGEEGIAEIRAAVDEIKQIVGEGGDAAKDAFAQDMEGNVLFVFPD